MKLNEVLTYTELCDELGDIALRGGTQRKKQFNRWLKSYEIEKVGRGQFVILRQLSEEEVQIAKDKDNYSQYLQHLLLKLFASQEEISHPYTYRELREQLAMVNRSYFPVKYGKENLSVDVVAKAVVNLGSRDLELSNSILLDEENWFIIADNHDKDALKYAMEKLQGKGLITVYPTYYFYKMEKIDEKTYIPIKSLATKEEKSELDQIKLDIVKEKGKEHFGEIYRSPKLLAEYQARVNLFLAKLGFDSYAKAFIVDRPANLKGVADYFAPKFNSMQVIRYLTTKRFEKIPRELHEQLTEKLIKY